MAFRSSFTNHRHRRFCYRWRHHRLEHSPFPPRNFESCMAPRHCARHRRRCSARRHRASFFKRLDGSSVSGQQRRHLDFREPQPIRYRHCAVFRSRIFCHHRRHCRRPRIFIFNRRHIGRTRRGISRRQRARRRNCFVCMDCRVQFRELGSASQRSVLSPATAHLPEKPAPRTRQTQTCTRHQHRRGL
jgi:hypothetical protein